MVVVDAKCTLMEFLWLQGEKTTVRGWNFFENVLKTSSMAEVHSALVFITTV